MTGTNRGMISRIRLIVSGWRFGASWGISTPNHLSTLASDFCGVAVPGTRFAFDGSLDVLDGNLTVIGDEAYRPDELCATCHIRPRGMGGSLRLCRPCYNAQPEVAAKERTYWQRRWSHDVYPRPRHPATDVVDGVCGACGQPVHRRV